jgi:hypothetical protein
MVVTLFGLGQISQNLFGVLKSLMCVFLHTLFGYISVGSFVLNYALFRHNIALSGLTQLVTSCPMPG